MSRTARLISGAAAVLALGAAQAQAAQGVFNCRNAQAEVTCGAQACEINSDGFTPMGVSLSGNRLEVCAYSSCQSGTVSLRRVRGDLLIVHANVGGVGGAAVVAFDRKQKIATLLWGNYALPLSCGQ